MLKQKLRRRLRTYDFSAYLYLLPAFLLLGIFTFYPILNTLLVSLKGDYEFLTRHDTGTSVKHYAQVIADPVFRRAIFNTAFIAFVCVPASMLLALLLALGLHSIRRFKGLFLTVFYLPQVTNVIAAGMVFAFIFNPHFGLMNMVLGWFGIEPIPWMSGEGIVSSTERYQEAYGRNLFMLFCFSLWDGLSLHVLIFLGGLQNINHQIYEASKIDGAGYWRMTRNITLPLLSPTTIFVFITSVIFAFRAYANVIALFGVSYGPPGDHSKMMITLVGYIMDALGNYLEPGAVSRAGAASGILMLMVIIVVGLQLILTRKWVHYQ